MITSKNDKITVVKTTCGKHYVLGYPRLPEIRDQETIDELHRQRLTSSAKKAQAWADRMGAKL